MIDLRQLIEDSFQLTELQKHPGWQVLHRRLNEFVAAHEARMMSGTLDDMLDYKYTSGLLTGIKHVLDLPRAQELALEQAKTGEGQAWVDEFQPELEPELVSAHDE